MPLESVLADAIGVDSVRIYECGGGDPLAAAREQWNDGANTLAVSPGKVICLPAKFGHERPSV